MMTSKKNNSSPLGVAALTTSKPKLVEATRVGLYDVYGSSAKDVAAYLTRVDNEWDGTCIDKDYYGDYEIICYRYESLSEVEKRLAAAEKRKKAASRAAITRKKKKEENDRKQYEKLKEKFGE